MRHKRNRHWSSERIPKHLAQELELLSEEAAFLAREIAAIAYLQGTLDANAQHDEDKENAKRTEEKRAKEELAEKEKQAEIARRIPKPRPTKKKRTGRGLGLTRLEELTSQELFFQHAGYDK